MDNEPEKKFFAPPIKMTRIVRESKENAEAIAAGLQEEIEHLIDLSGCAASIICLVVPYNDEVTGEYRLASVSNIRSEHEVYADNMLQQLAESRDPQHNLELPAPDGPEVWPEDIDS